MNLSFTQRVLPLLLSFVLSIIIANASETMVTIAGVPVSTDEFTAIYKKNNINNSADFSKESIESYLELFINYKLKVQSALDLGLDTQPDLVAEYKSYEQQLFDAYINKKIIDPLVKQSFERLKTDVAVSHIFLNAATPNAEATIKDIYQQLNKGASFEELAKKYSEDANSAPLGGKIGYFTALQIGYPQLENAAYNTEVGKYSAPIQTPIGFHIIKVTDKRPARGRIKVSIIKRLIPENTAEIPEAQKLVDSLYKVAASGADFGDLATKYSEDPKSKLGAGELEWFGINTYTEVFENAAFALQKDGEISKPIRTESAWYIIKRNMATLQLTYEEAEPVIKAKLQKSRLYNETLDRFYEDLKTSFAYEENVSARERFKKNIEPFINRYPFKYEESATTETVVTMNGTTYDNNEMGKLVNRTASKVVAKSGNERLDALYEEATRQLLMDELKEKLPQRDSEYKALLEEYRNGVLIFELTRNNVWNKAVTDSVGLKNYFQKNRQNYRWNKRAVGVKFSYNNEAQKTILEKLLKANAHNDVEKWKKILEENQLADVVKVEKWQAEMDNSNPSAFNFSKGIKTTQEGEQFSTIRISEIREPENKNLEDCRGFVIAAYQESLDKQWVADLRAKYPVQIHPEVIQQLIKK